ncbi:MAG TPA: NAD(P)H-quinone oxidoreductase [Gemmatimonadota bacterium]
MRAILVREPGDPDQLVLGEFPTPEPAPGDLLVKVKAAGVNRADVLQRRGRYPPPPGASPILGLEMAGVVGRVEPEAPVDRSAPGRSSAPSAELRPKEWRPGDRVCGLLPGGGYAEYAVLPAGLAMPIPENLSFEQAAAIPEVFLTAYQCLVWIGGLRAVGGASGSSSAVRSGRTDDPLSPDRWSGTPDWMPRDVLVHAGASGVGTAAIQLVGEAGARALVTAGSERKLEACRDLGAATTFDYKAGPFAPGVLEATGGRGVDLVLDVVGAPYWEQNLECLATDGRIVLIATMGGRRVEGADVSVLVRKRASVVGTTLRARGLGYKLRLTCEFADWSLPRFADGRLRPVIDRVFSWEAAADAHRYIEENRNIGKIILAGM